MKAIAIIVARGGSKRIPRKNIKLFLGRPIIKYSIEAALKSACFSEVMVSTDDKEIAEISLKAGAKVPFFRSEKNSDDQASTAEVIKEVLQEYKKLSQEYDYVCCLYPTAPFVTSERLIEAMKLLENSRASSVLPVMSFSQPIQRSFRIDSAGVLKMNWPENINVRSQDLPPTYHDSGQFYCLRVKEFLIHKKLFMDDTRPLIISELEGQDIDNLTDWQLAEMKYQLVFPKKYEE